MKILVAITLILGYSSATSYSDVLSDEWKAWKIQHKKSYNDRREEDFRVKIFMENKISIARHNAKAHMGLESYFVKMNAFGDLLDQEFIDALNGYQHQNAKNERLDDAITQIQPANVDLPKEIDWREKGAVTEVKDQGMCGSCWAFSATGSLEGQHFRKTGKLVSLSEQNLVDCSEGFDNYGCDGGSMHNAFRYIKANGGIDTEKSYPYNIYGEASHCKFTKGNIGATDKGFVDVTAGNEDALKAAVATIGPVSIAIDASSMWFRWYSHGIYKDAGCEKDADKLNHAVLVVGYGTTEKSDYWLVKNSWGETWGDKGYVKMARNKNNQCGIATAGQYPIV